MPDISKTLTGFTLKDNTLSRAVKENPKDKIEIELGDSKQPDFKPQFKVMRWDNEVNFSMRAVEDPTATVETVDGTVKYKAKDYEVHQYEKPVDEDGGFEFEWVLPKKPKSNVLTATIQTKELDFFYQPALTEQEIANGAQRPDNVVGSYAVYHKTKGGMNDSAGMEYKTGKAFHIYRPEAVDATGARTWCELNVDVDAGVLIVTVPQKFLDTAVYPVVVDPTFGYTSSGASSQNVAYRYSTSVYEAKRRGNTVTGVAGTLDKISAYLFTTDTNDSVDFTFAIDTKDSDGANSHGQLVRLTGTYTGPTSNTLKEVNAASQSLTAVNYVLNIFGDPTDLNSAAAAKYLKIAYDDAGSTGQTYFESWSGIGAYASAAENPWTNTPTSNSYYHSIYATYTATGSPSSSVSPSVSPSSSVSPSVSPSASVSPSSSVSPSVSPSSSVSPSVSPSSSESSSPSPSNVSSESPSVSPSVSPSSSVSPSVSPSASVSPSSSVSPSVSPSSSVSPSVSPSASVSPSSSVSPSVSPSASVSPSVSPSSSQSPSVSPSSSQSPSVSPSISPSVSPSSSVSPSVSPSSSVSQSVSPSSSNSPSMSPSSSESPSPSSGTPQYYKNEPLHIKSGNYIFHLGAHRMPVWNETGKPASPRMGIVGYNIDTLAIELWDGSVWKTFNSV